jgi:hypothetical protein
MSLLKGILDAQASAEADLFLFHFLMVYGEAGHSWLTEAEVCVRGV